jgi:HD-GYP domain-containing protein (c-di-GMP phosphodiesterase class II)
MLHEEEADRIGLAAYVCNIGMVGDLERLVAKPGPLTLEERRVMEGHALVGARMLRAWEEIDPAMGEIALAVQHHHERWDGRGYPDGLQGDAIPLASRVICVAEAYQAMLSPRPYREPRSMETAKARITAAAGAQFDPDVAAALIAWRSAEEGSP